MKKAIAMLTICLSCTACATVKTVLPFLKTSADVCVELAVMKCRPDVARLCGVVADAAGLVDALQKTPTPDQCEVK